MNDKLLRNSWKLVEILDLGSDSLSAGGGRLVQLFHNQRYSHAKTDNDEAQENSLWFIGGVSPDSTADSFICTLLQKAVTKDVFKCSNELFLTPSLFAASDDVDEFENLVDFDFSSISSHEKESIPGGVSTLLRWAKQNQPRALVTFSVGHPMIRYLNTPDVVSHNISQFTDRPVYEFGNEPEIENDDGSISPREDISQSFGKWCTEQGMSWIDFSIDIRKKAFDEIIQTEWKTDIGPVLKWLVEGPRFNPPKEETGIEDIEIIPVLQMPTEFANL